MISFNNKEIERPLKLSMLRDCVCKRDFKYGIGFHSFNTSKIIITKTNEFSGIKLYIDNMFLCDESELIPLLLTYGLIKHTENELIQSVRAVGVIIYITDKVNISTNARRTFIEIADNDAIEFLRYIADFIEEIYKARYDLSRYRGKQNCINADKEELERLRIAAENSIKRLASDKVEIDTLEWNKPDFNELEDVDKKREVKIILTKNINNKIKDYIFQTDSFDYSNIVDDFITWLINNN